MKDGSVMLVSYLENAAEKIKVFDFSEPANLIKNIEMPGFGAVPVSSGGHKDYELFFKFQTFTDPGSIYRLDMNSYEVKSLRRPKLEHLKLNLNDFTTDQAWYTSYDGTKVPMFLIRKKSILPSLDKKPTKPIPTILYGYGGFGNPETPSFNLMNLVFMNNLDGMYVVANIRGGGEFGKQWHETAV
jgi:prolyl oligopeptidase